MTQEKYVERTFMKYSSDDIALDRAGEMVLLSCNEALARGAIEAGVRVAASYPGSPLPYVMDNLAIAASAYPEMHVQWSTNEKTAYEVTLGASMAGVRAFCPMKNVGMNWIMDPLASSQLNGTSGLVIVVADDPGAETTQNEQDTRYLAMFTEIPVLEPSTMQEVKDFTAEAFELSERLMIPVVLRVMERLGYGREPVVLGPIKHEVRKREARYVWNTAWNLPWPERAAAARHKRFHGEVSRDIEEMVGSLPKADAVEKAVDELSFNVLQMSKGAKLGIIAAAMTYPPLVEALDILNAVKEVSVLKLGVTYPLPRKKVERLLAETETVLVVEEIDPVIEEQARSISADMASHARILGKLTGHLPYSGEIGRNLIGKTVGDLLGKEFRPKVNRERIEKGKRLRLDLRAEAIARPCPGCPEFAAIFALKMAAKDLEIYQNLHVYGDDGCSGLSLSRLLGGQNSGSISMGAGGGIASGNYHAGLKDPVVQVIGDSAFLHAGIPGLINAVYNRADLFMLILDNRTTGMTGHQPHPAAFGITATNQPTKTLDIIDLVKAIQVDRMEVVDPYDYKATFDVMKNTFTQNGVRVVISRRTCAVIAQRQQGGSDAKLDTNLPTIDREKCKSWSKGECNVCLDDFGCVAIMGRENDKLGIRSPEIDWSVCVGCQVCISKCEHEAIAQFRGEK